MRKRQIIIPGGNDTLEVGDSVVVVTMSQGLEDLEEILKRVRQRQKLIPLGRASISCKIVEPVVVKPETVSKNASTKVVTMSQGLEDLEEILKR